MFIAPSMGLGSGSVNALPELTESSRLELRQLVGTVCKLDTVDVGLSSLCRDSFRRLEGGTPADVSGYDCG